MKAPAHTYLRIRLAGTLLAAAASMSPSEFVEVQQLSAEDLRARFGLPPSCDPSVTAVATDPAVSRVTVAIECRVRPGETPPSGPTDRPRPARRGTSGS
jgi:hypothetical protein